MSILLAFLILTGFQLDLDKLTPPDPAQTHVEWVPKGQKRDRIQTFQQFCGWQVVSCSKLKRVKPFGVAPKERGYYCTFQVNTAEADLFDPNSCP